WIIADHGEQLSFLWEHDDLAGPGQADESIGSILVGPSQAGKLRVEAGVVAQIRIVAPDVIQHVGPHRPSRRLVGDLAFDPDSTFQLDIDRYEVQSEAGRHFRMQR